MLNDSLYDLLVWAKAHDFLAGLNAAFSPTLWKALRKSFLEGISPCFDS